MENQDNKMKKKQIKENTFREYFTLIRSNLLVFLLISGIIVSASIIYAITSEDIYKSSTVLKISQPKGNILESPFESEFKSFTNDRFIANEIEAMKNITIRQEVARVMIDTIKSKGNTDGLDLLLYDDAKKVGNDINMLRSERSVAGVLSTVEIEQKNGLDYIEIKAQSPSPEEAALIANSYAKVYRDFNLMDNRKHLTNVKDFLKKQVVERRNELIAAENEIKDYKLKGGVVQLDQQALMLLNRMDNFESKQNEAKIDMTIAEKKLNTYKDELKNRNPSVAEFVESEAAKLNLEQLQGEIAGLKKTRDELRNPTPDVVEQYNKRIENLNDKLQNNIKEYRELILSASPEDMKGLSEKILEQEVQYSSLLASYNQTRNIVSQYESEFNRLPARTLDLARLEREKAAAESMYQILEQKYQEALINEQSTIGNVLIMNTADVPGRPAEPNRGMIIFMGLILGVGSAFSFVYFRDFLDRRVKSPEDIEKLNINILGWIPKIPGLKGKKPKSSEFIAARESNTINSEAFKTLRTRIQFSRIHKTTQSILITSSAPGEGKTMTSANLAASFAQANKKTVIIDCDLRKPRIHSFFNVREYPGLTNYFFGRAKFDEIIRRSEVENLDYITAGVIPPNPSEIIGSPEMKEFVEKLKETYDKIILDAPPIMSVSDAEVLSRIVDAAILVVSAESTEIDWVIDSTDLLKHEHDSFIGVILNKFNYKSGYHSYYKYHSYYSKTGSNIEGKILKKS